MFVRVLYPASFEKGVLKVCVLSFDNEHFCALGSHRLFPCFHVPELLLFLFIVWRWRLWLFFLFNFLSLEIDGFQLRWIGKVEFLSVLILPLEIGNFNQLIPCLYAINGWLSFFVRFFWNFLSIVGLNIAILSQWIHESFSSETRLNDNQRVISKVLGDFLSFNLVKKGKFGRWVGHILWLIGPETYFQSFLRLFVLILVAGIEFLYLLETVLVVSWGLSFICEFFGRWEIFPWH